MEFSMSHLSGIRNLGLAVLSLAMLAGCALPVDEDEPQVAMGDFSLGHNIVISDDPELGPFSRTATDEEWVASLTAAIDKRLGGYDGDKLYNLGITVEAYALALPGVPVVFTPKSALVINVLVWDDAAQKRLNPEVKQLAVFESVSGDTLISSGLTQSREEQMANLSRNAAKAVQDYLLKNPEWFGLPPLEAGSAVAEPATVNIDEVLNSPVESAPVEVRPLDSTVPEAAPPAN
jgi:hypothetical protein